MKPRLKLAPEPALSPERAELAFAITEAGPKHIAAGDARTAAERARGDLARAAEELPAAERAAAECKAYIVENPHAPRTDLRAKRQAVADAADDLAIAREVSERAEAALDAVNQSARCAEERVARAADAVLFQGFPAALAAAEAAGREFYRLAQVARYMADKGNAFDGERHRAVGSVDTLNAHWAYRGDQQAREAAAAAATAPWVGARQALMSEPTAPLPAIG